MSEDDWDREHIVDPPDPSIWQDLPASRWHPYTCGICNWGRSPENFSVEEYEKHMKNVHGVSKHRLDGHDCKGGVKGDLYEF